MSGLRLFIGIPLAVAVTVGLFLVMNGMISKPVDFPPPGNYADIKINPDIPDPDGPEPPDLGPTTITEPTPPRIPTTYTDPNRRTPDPIVIDPAPPSGGGGEDIGIPKILSPIVRIEPPYPERCLNRGKEGNAMVEFDITAEGAVTNVRVISSSDRCFNHRSVIDAVSRWRYSPPGKLVRGQRTTLTFTLAQ